jgi:hypothetical protein
VQGEICMYVSTSSGLSHSAKQYDTLDKGP